MEQNKKGVATAEQIAEWKKGHGEIFKLEVGEHVAYLRKPDRKVLGFAAVSSNSDPMKYNEAVLKNCWLGGSSEIMEDDMLFVSAGTVLGQLIELKEATLEKL